MEGILSLVLSIALVIAAVVAVFVAVKFIAGLAGAAVMTAGLAFVGCGSMFAGIVIIIAIASACGFIAAQVF